ncbi:alanine dehydrogenase [Companilactobacillus halodurans]|uniref:Alanine dehydrogenase n=1 Tax=Companilactobacillus halodurans TaxID=2584183 RepID=A0A5P0ZUE5_9LACO|nr:alanine dehydrogenase [Companilactobacillus halodurans]MQS76135.1 alanine dehydrogenase [Companilactobacillus halodurans]MQS96706.1 alanine dehydrogenase [Companilactobacillus halodurans]
MIVGVPKELKKQEDRVGSTPDGVAGLVKAGHQVLVEDNAGLGSGYTNQQYLDAGASIVTQAEAWNCEMIIKVKEPIESEYKYFKAGQIIYTYLHLAANKKLTEALLESKATGIAYETMIGPDGSLPLLFPMSEIAGRMAVQVGAHFLEKPHLGKGLLLSGVPGVKKGKVTIIGGGTVGVNAAKIAIGMGASVTLLDINPKRLEEIENIFSGKIQTLMSNSQNIAHCVKESDLVIGAVLIPGAATPKLVTEKMIASMEAGSVVVDIPIDQGGLFETSVKATTHEDPVYVSHGVVHYTVANIPGAVPKTATQALSSVTMPYALAIADKGVSLEQNKTIQTGINTYQGKLTQKAVADSLNLEYSSLIDIIMNDSKVKN